VTFNPSQDPDVKWFKAFAVGYIDACNKFLLNAKDGEEKRLWSLAMTSIEEAAMWAVKAATFGK
jgi:hypothetical protein